MTADSLGDRMKGYESVARATLPRRMPVILRVDGRAFHTYTRGCARPFDQAIGDAMVATAIELCAEVQGAVLAYTQSNEISLLVHGYKRLSSQAWFDNQIQKMTSIAASIATACFTRQSSKIFGETRDAHFDARVFVLPESEVCNYFLWRQQDATRNSIQMLARSLYSQRALHQKNTSELQELTFQKGHNWNDLPVRRRGVCIVRTEPTEAEPRGRWDVDLEPPIFSKHRRYIERHLAVIDETPVHPMSTEDDQ